MGQRVSRSRGRPVERNHGGGFSLGLDHTAVAEGRLREGRGRVKMKETGRAGAEVDGEDETLRGRIVRRRGKIGREKKGGSGSGTGTGEERTADDIE